ncbi:MAG: hypothetical protein H0T92_05285 [Pyrinomonadaceae bacterium]|nr:hypothetical protein [Pyrinomonadaceae bacterium]
MKNLLATFLCLVVLMAAALPAGAQTRNKRYRDRTYSAEQQNRYDRSRRSYDDYYGDDRSVWQKHRDKITTAGGAAGGAILGGLIGGKKGAAIGAITGGAGAGIYTYKIRKKDHRRF